MKVTACWAYGRGVQEWYLELPGVPRIGDEVHFPIDPFEDVSFRVTRVVWSIAEDPWLELSFLNAEHETEGMVETQHEAEQIMLAAVPA